MEREAKRNYDDAVSDMRFSGRFKESQIAKIERAQILVESMNDVK